ncbi:hypothetical protein QRO08_11780 [Paracidovorax citrulli]|uniref:Uncharacterized protein n=2 Tax=Paracidovorax citrulli TaxID=80869 RepID=A1TQS4_PARC0|nr:hypothetical protein [Paracidovorax citrulli]ABM33312.1 hypothetical protein Aave_2744 [Paracidovorax citrulli AAC00-1]MVT28898.1 hypothetical protein [Paracidovorax citrulli]MVT36581.1 hypothetical protein [Paracidovorax citrulli]UMT83256.1 hypothetical protein FRC75_07670 [Paracidovorax citrulli]WIY31580.1 hypothetical protein QRO09_07655 [Paracidovorax citrulli]
MNMVHQSPALRAKIAKTRAGASSDLPLIRSAAQVVLAWIADDGDLPSALAAMKAMHGTNWSLTTALQVLSGRRGQFAAECGLPDERARLFLAHLVAKSTCSGAGLGAVSQPTQEEFEELQKHVASRFP